MNRMKGLGTLRRAQKLSDEEQTVIRRIEAARAELERSDAEIETIDYGAGPDGSRTADEMARGVRVMRGVSELCRSSSKPPDAARLLFRLVRERRPGRSLELGTCLGISAAYQAAALELNGQGSLITLEGAPAVAARARSLLEELGLGRRVEVLVGRFVDLLPGLVERHRFDFAFIDGHHDEAATVDYFRRIRPAMSSGGLLVFDDIEWSDGMRRAWRTIRSDSHVAKSSTRQGLGLAALR